MATDMPERGSLLFHGSVTHYGMPNVVRVIRHDGVPASEPYGFYAVFVNPSNTRELRGPTDREFFIWWDDRARERMSPYTGIETPALQATLMEASA